MIENSNNGLASLPSQPNDHERDARRFSKLVENGKAPSLLWIQKEDGTHAIFTERGYVEDAVQVEIVFVDSAGTVYSVNQDSVNLRGIRIFFLKGKKLLISYETLDHTYTGYCSWGHKKSSAVTEKLSVFFKTDDTSYLVYVDAEKPEHQFFLSGQRENDEWDPVQNLYCFLKDFVSRPQKENNHV